MVESGLKHTHSGGGQGQLQGPGPTAGVQAAVGAMPVLVECCGCGASPWAHYSGGWC